jgi:AmmeMemoRadiSam system protein B
MTKNILMTAITPHPPIIVPEVGQGEELKSQKTIEGLQKLSQEIVGLKPETIVIITPHSEFNPYFFSVYSNSLLNGNFGMFRAPEVKLEFENDLEFIEELELKAKENFIKLNRLPSKTPLDHGCMVPLYYLSKAGYKSKIVVINYTMLDKEKHKLFGKYIAETAEKLNRKTVFIASGDLSHRLKPGAPAGYEPDAKDFDELIVDSIKIGNYEAITNISFEMRNIAGECGYNSLMVAFGVINNTPEQNEVISYEGPFGVGYIVAKL